MSTAYDFDKKTQVKQWEVQIDSKAQYGYFESETTGTSGGLWFEKNALIDYDGVFELSKSVIEAIKALGFDASYAEDTDD